MGNHGGILSFFGDVNGAHGFRERADLIDLDEDGVGLVTLNSFE